VVRGFYKKGNKIMKKYNYVINKINENTYCLKEYVGTYSYLLLGNKKAMLIDTGCGCGDLLKTVRSITDLDIEVVNSHGHFDHIGANYQFNKVWIAQEDEALMQKNSSSEVKNIELRRYLLKMDTDFDNEELERIIELPQTNEISYLHDKMNFDLGNRTIEAISTPGHTHGSFCFLDRNNRQLYTADTICDISVLLFFNESESVEVFRNGVEKLYELKNEYDVIFPGHHTVPLETHIIDNYKSCAEKILNHTLTGTKHIEEIGYGLKAHYNNIAIVYSDNNIYN
jgi:glyoxylase-like metal-dependent hydrolase (beta-lactamase superfamily II)